MCGVAGVIDLRGDSISPTFLKAMTDSIAHRGPDGEGQWIEGNVGIGHRRLSIIDPSPAGHQPMISADGQFVLSYNGELYNFLEIRAELENLGYKFAGRSDSEVVLYALAEWKHGAISRFNGMFALAFFDRGNQQLLLARDRYGIKPLYFAFQDGFFYFASEQRAILNCSTFRSRINLEAVVEYLTFQNFLTSQTLTKDVEILPAGTYGMLSRKGQSLTIRSYWDFQFQDPETSASSGEYLEELDRLTNQAVARQLVSDVEVGAYLSGGIDSGLITGRASSLQSELKTFTIGFDLSSATGPELHFDERSKAEAASAAFGTEHYEMVLKSGDMEKCIPVLAKILEEPRVGQSYPNFYAAKLASKFVKVVLSGSGGDELFGGYPWRYYRAAQSKSFDDYVDAYYQYWQRLLSNTELRQLLSPIWGNVNHVWTRDIFEGVFKGHETSPRTKADFINHSLYFECKTFLHGLLIVEDKLSMAHGLESRVPFLDNDLVDFSMSLPVRLKVRQSRSVPHLDENFPGSKKDFFFESNSDGKLLLRKLAHRYLPGGSEHRRKQGFSAPDQSWFRGESMKFVSNQILNPEKKVFEIIDFDFTRELVRQHSSGEKNRRLLIWSLIQLSLIVEDFH